MKMKRIPTRVRLPFGYDVRVRQVSKRECQEAVGCDALAGWVASDRTVYLIRSRPIRLKRADLAHELQHVLIDYLHVLVGQGLAKHE